MLTPRENFLCFLRKQPYEWTPTNLDMLPFRPAFIPDNVARGMVAQQESYVGDFGGKDMFGVEWKYDPLVCGSMDLYPFSDDLTDWETFLKLPDLDAFDWDRHAKENAEYLNTDKLITSTIFTGFFERLISFVGFDNAAMALADEDQHEAINAIFSRLCEVYIDFIGRMKKYFNVELIELHDDWGTQISLMMSVETHRQLIVPYIKRITTAAAELGVFIEQHSCGRIEPLFPNIIKSGTATWRGQDICDRQMLIDRYGDQYRFAVYLRPEEGMDDAAALQYAREELARWSGKNVWFWIWPMLPLEQQRMIAEMVKESTSICV